MTTSQPEHTPTIAVIGATGQQGGATADALLEAGAAGQQIAALFGNAEGRDARFEALPLDALADDPDSQSMFAWIARLPADQANFALTRDLDPEVRDLPGWLAHRPD
jgi:uncharacterized protein YbjT (DUF2867 family)